MAVYAVADLHGQFNTFEKGLNRIGFSDSDQLYVIGDAIDRGPDGIKILQQIMNSRNMDLIMGNHEFMMLNSVDLNGECFCNGQDAYLWLDYNGGRITFKKYKALKAADRGDLLLWLSHRYVMKTIELNGYEYCFTHSYYKEGLENKIYSEMDYSDVWTIVWSSPYRDDYATKAEDIYGNYNKTFITGHIPAITIMRWFEGKTDYNELDIYKKGNFIDIDGGCSFGADEALNNGAIFLRLDDMKSFPIKIES